MAKAQKRSNREKKKPKADKKAADATPSVFGSIGQQKPGQGAPKKPGR